MKKTTFKNILDKRKIEIRNPSKHWTLKSKSCVYIAGETISWRIHKKKDSSSQLTCRVQ